MHRRDFIKGLSAAGISAYQPWGFAQCNDETIAPNDVKYLVLIELQGGNDGLNTVVPFANPQYYSLRPRIAIDKDLLHCLDESHGLHPAMSRLMPLWKKNQLAIVNGVGYPNPNLSHFRSIEIWETASDADETRLNGWLEPLIKNLPKRVDSAVKAVAIDDDEGPLSGSIVESVVFDNLDTFVKQAKELGDPGSKSDNPALDHIFQVQQAVQSAADCFALRLRKHRPANGFRLPEKRSVFQRRLLTVKQIIQNELGPQIFKISLGSFDTHANQVSRHHGLLKQFSDAVADFQLALEKSGHWNQVLIMTYSEFGRRAGENASKGTDHGTAAPHLLVGGKVSGGLYGRAPSLIELTDGDVSFTTDFRQLYSTVAQEWFGLSLASSSLSRYQPLGILD